MAPAASFVDEHLLRIGTIELHRACPLGDVPPGRLAVEKPRELVDRYIDLCATFEPTRIVELGINRGGSTAMISALARPEKLVAVELSGTPVALLDAYIREGGLSEVVRPYYGVDQVDRIRLAEIMAAEFGDEAIDLVVDDASHFYEETLASFEALFPLLRADGLFVIEDWNWQHRIGDGMARALLEDSAASERLRAGIEARIERESPQVPLSRLVVELLLARTSADDVVRELVIGPYWAVVRRGAASLDPNTFRVADLYNDHFGMVSTS